MPSSGEGTCQTENRVHKIPEAEHAQQRAQSEARDGGAGQAGGQVTEALAGPREDFRCCSA